MQHRRISQHLTLLAAAALIGAAAPGAASAAQWTVRVGASVSEDNGGILYRLRKPT